MDKKILILCSLLLMVSFCTGIFMEIIVPDHISLSPDPPGFWISLWGTLKSDIFLVMLAVFFTLTIYLTPCMFILVVGKTFALGFSSAYLLSANTPGLWILLSILFTRALLKLPAYMALTIHSWQTAKQLKAARRYSKKTVKPYLLCFLVLAVSSIIEVLLLQIIS